MTLSPPLRALVREDLAELEAYAPHEGAFEVRLDANEAPDLFSADAHARLSRAALEHGLARYPDVRARALKDAIARRTGARPEELLVGVGSDEVIALLLTALDRPRKKGQPPAIVTSTPTFVMYRVSAKARGYVVVEVPLDARWRPSLPSLVHAVGMVEANIVFVATPNNPTGTTMSRDDVLALAAAAKDSLVVIDEAYAPFADESLGELFDSAPNLAFLGTLSKIGLAALRIGWLRAHPELVAELDKVRQPYNVPAVTQRMATVALDELSGELDGIVSLVREERTRLTLELERLGHAVTPSAANFLWVKTARPAAEVFEALAARSVLVRSFHQRGGRMASHLRITIGRPSDNDRLLSALASCGG